MKKNTLLNIEFLLFFLLLINNINSQVLENPIIIDGDNCTWGTPSVVDGNDSNPASADILNLWVGQDTDNIYLAFDREKKVHRVSLFM